MRTIEATTILTLNSDCYALTQKPKCIRRDTHVESLDGTTFIWTSGQFFIGEYFEVCICSYFLYQYHRINFLLSLHSKYDRSTNRQQTGYLHVSLIPNQICYFRIQEGCTQVLLEQTLFVPLSFIMLSNYSLPMFFVLKSNIQWLSNNITKRTNEYCYLRYVKSSILRSINIFFLTLLTTFPLIKIILCDCNVQIMLYYQF